ncbi:MAG: putative aliphatic sulfonates transport permease protein SsuC [Syntrophorhabdus sp. PtaU1.Bin153]|nr:MAG: putative aliphatic sulfonates transport permease protein SsuC [Syntrophorhabdus sp. PtaU1.Bin153]
MEKGNNVTKKKIDWTKILYPLIAIAAFIGLWQMAAWSYKSNLLLPPPLKTIQALWRVLQDASVLKNLLLTLRRVLTGFSIACMIGLPLGFAMGTSRALFRFFDPLISSIRQVPMMAWVPLTIIWFGLGDGPTLFLIAMVGIFPIILNTIAGVRSISPTYYHAARSMGSGPWSIFARVILPASMPDILTGMRLSMGMGWMSVICAEFIATSAGFGFAMVEAQTRMETDSLLALMIMGASVGFAIDKSIRFVESRLTHWRYAK